MRNTIVLSLFLLTVQTISQDIRSIYLSELKNTKYECDTGGCTPSTIISSANLRRCQIACLKNEQCRTVTFDQDTNQCEMFADIPSQYGNLSPQIGVITMIADDERLLSAPIRSNVTDPMNPCASGSLRWNKTGITTLKWPQITNAVNIFTDPNDTLYIADEYTYSVIWKLLPNSTVPIVTAGIRDVQGSNATLLNYPQDAYVDRNQNLYVSDNDNGRVQKFVNGSTDGITIFGVNSTEGSTLDRLYSPRFFTFDETETYLYIADQGNNCIIRILTNSTSGSNGTVVAGGTWGSSNTTLSWPYGVASRPSLSSDLYITNYGSHSVIRWTPGAISGVFIAGTPGSSGSSSTTLNSPMGIKLDNYLNVYVADGSNNRIQMFCANSSIGVTIAGTSIAGSNATQLSQPRGIAFDSSMNMYVADFLNYRVQKFMRL